MLCLIYTISERYKLPYLTVISLSTLLPSLVRLPPQNLIGRSSPRSVCFHSIFLDCTYQLLKYGFSGFFLIWGPFQLIGWLIQTSQNLSYSPHSMEVKKAKQTYFIQGQLPQLLLRSALFSVLFTTCVV